MGVKILSPFAFRHGLEFFENLFKVKRALQLLMAEHKFECLSVKINNGGREKNILIARFSKKINKISQSTSGINSIDMRTLKDENLLSISWARSEGESGSIQEENSGIRKN
jgi:hypothetical protein